MNALLKITAAVSILWSTAALSEAYPSRPITLVVPYSAGSGIDFLGRLIGSNLSQRLGQSVIVDNRAGAAGNIGAEHVAKSAADGYTLMITTNLLSVMPALYDKLAFDPVTSFDHIARFAKSNMALVVNPAALPNMSFDKLVATIRANPGKRNYSSPGKGTAHHLGMELLKRKLNLDIVHVPYRGATTALNDLIAGHVEMAMFPINVIVQQVRSGKLNAIAVSGKSRSLFAPQIPTFDELGLHEVDISNSFFISAPAGLPADVKSRIHQELAETMKSKEFLGALEKQGLEPDFSTPEELTRQIQSEGKLWKPLLSETGIKPDK